jgi:hypothetical protein
MTTASIRSVNPKGPGFDGNEETLQMMVVSEIHEVELQAELFVNRTVGVGLATPKLKPSIVRICELIGELIKIRVIVGASKLKTVNDVPI